MCSPEDRCSMATPALNSQVQSLVAEYGVFWQLWPQFEQTHGERHLVGFEVELIGCHTSDLNHIDPACPSCRGVRSILLEITVLLHSNIAGTRNSFAYSVDSHANSIMCLPVLGGRAAVWVTVRLSCPRADDQSLVTDLLDRVRTVLHQWGIHQR